MDASPTTRGRVDKAPFQFGLASLLLFTLSVSLAASLFRTLGVSTIPCLAGVFGACIGYHVTTYIRHDRLFHVLLGYEIGWVLGIILLGMIGGRINDNTRWAAFEAQARARFDALLLIQGGEPSAVFFHAIVATLGTLIPTTVVAIFKLRKARQSRMTDISSHENELGSPAEAEGPGD